ncbi:DgyrCDS10712 [Dimorphilus gyrociliatus]|uniref:DgyrCDS10712 n=1 Tax=Dimorphilus gyrociliatus TaxID=2664684 RepID=A0A7I8W285_9ANNE|nr:DgyrCDS10712 [Dimorphilus gyrociliatus]
MCSLATFHSTINSSFILKLVSSLIGLLVCFLLYSNLQLRNDFQYGENSHNSDIEIFSVDEDVKLEQQERDQFNDTAPVWRKINNEHLYIYSAYYDDRNSLGSWPQIQIIVVGQKSTMEGSTQFCRLQYDSGKLDIVDALVNPAGIGIGHDGVWLREYVLTCQLKHFEIPRTVGITRNKADVVDLKINIIKPNKPKVKKDFGLCIICAFWNIEPLRIIQYVELYRLLGVSKIFVYNNNLYKDSLATFKKYEKIGLVNVRDFKTGYFVHQDPDRPESGYKSQASGAVNDCILRNMHVFKKLIIVDLDEIILPHQHDNFKDLINYMDDQFPTSHPGRSYVFRNAYFFTDFQQNEEFPPELTVLRTQTRAKVSNKGYSVKSIIDPQSCEAMHNHICWKYTKLHDISGRSVEVPPNIGLMHHYKKCHFTISKCGKMLALPVTFGGNGFIGTACISKLIDSDHKIVIVSRGNWYFDSDNIIKPNVRQIKCNRREELSRCEELMKFIDETEKIDAVLDFSGISDFHSAQVLKHFNRTNVEFHLHISTDSLYDISKLKESDRYSKESDSIRPKNEKEKQKIAAFNDADWMYKNPVYLPDFKVELTGDDLDSYGDLKLAAEEVIVKSFDEGNAPNYIFLRLPAVVGSRDTTYRWWLYQLWIRMSQHIPENPVPLPKAIKDRPMSVVYVEDVATVVENVLANPRAYNKPYNLAIEETPTLTEFLKEIEANLGVRKANYKVVEEGIYAYPDVRRGPVDISRAKEELQFKPTSLKEVVRRTIKYYEDAMSKLPKTRDEFLKILIKEVFNNQKEKFIDKVGALYNINLDQLKVNVKEEL